MKKILSIIFVLCVSIAGAGLAQAALLDSWQYTLSSIELSHINNDFAYTYDSNFIDAQGATYRAGAYTHSIEPKYDAPVTGSANFTGQNVALSEQEVLLRYDTTLKDQNYMAAGVPIADLSFSYDVSSVGGEVSMNVAYTLSLYSYYDVHTQSAYVYFNNNQVTATGMNTSMYNGYVYGVLGFNLYVDGRAFTQVTGDDGNTYSGWAINEDTRNNYYDSYVVGADNTALDAKYWTGAFDITSDIVMVNYSLFAFNEFDSPRFVATYMHTSTTPTPEPATMLLMGAGLAGLGFGVRRKK